MDWSDLSHWSSLFRMGRLRLHLSTLEYLGIAGVLLGVLLALWLIFGSQ